MSATTVSPQSRVLPISGPCTRFKLAILESDPAILNYLQSSLGYHYELGLFTNATDLLAALEDQAHPHLLVLAWQSSAESIPLLLHIQELAPRLPVVVLSYSSDLEMLIASPRLGVRGVVLKPFMGDELEIAIDEHLIGVEHSPSHSLGAEIPLNGTNSFVCSSKRMREIETQARMVARSDIPILILGQSGTGKEVLAQYTHLKSARSQQTFLKINCAAMPAELIESELFGHEQGAFTGAVKAKQGKFEMCHRGTIFLDEIGEMPAGLQAKLLQVLQDGTFSRLGGRSTISVDVRVIAATNINMKEAIAQKKFREDLYYRLNGFTINLPPLRERREEIPVLAHYFMRKGAKRHGLGPLPISPHLMNALCEYAWPGNLRELENVINRYIVIGSEKQIMVELTPYCTPLSASMEARVDSAAGGLKRMVRTMKGEAESTVIAEALKGTGWNRKAAASDLKISYKALLYKIKQYNLEPQSRVAL